MDTLQVKVLREGARLPVRATELAAGLDVYAFLDRPRTILPGHWEAIPTGIAIRPPAGHEVQVRPRGGLAYKYGLTILNAPGTVDEDYTGEVQVILINHGDKSYIVDSGERVAQLVVTPVAYVAVERVEELPTTARGEGRFGSTGTTVLAVDVPAVDARADAEHPPTDWERAWRDAVRRAEQAEKERDQYREIFHELSAALNANTRGRDRIDAMAVITALKAAAGEPAIHTDADGTLTVLIEKHVSQHYSYIAT